MISFLYDFMVKKLKEKPNITRLVIFSDSAGGQNNNRFLMRFLSWFAHSRHLTIEQVFPVSGHSFNQCNRNFGMYSKVVKK